MWCPRQESAVAPGLESVLYPTSYEGISRQQALKLFPTNTWGPSSRISQVETGHNLYILKKDARYIMLPQ
jgi:hypothetical protein